MAKPNFVFILIDDLGWMDLGCYGSSFYETPHLDKLAQEGMRFTDAYAACPVCSPTRASILTGKYPATVNLTDFIAGHWRPYAKLVVPKFNLHLPNRLRAKLSNHRHRLLRRLRPPKITKVHPPDRR